MNKNLKQLINILNDGKYHSGNALGEKLNITRSAVWKFIKQLKSYGLPIDSIKAKGYCLKQPIILLDSNKIKKYIATSSRGLTAGSRNNPGIKIFTSISSTIDYLKTLSSRGLTAGSIPQICLAEQQTAGKGRLGRTWQSPFGLNIYLSCLWNFNKDISELSGLSLIVGLSVIKALEPYTKDLKIKWPNDILYEGKKLAGILVEINAETNGYSRAIISVGLNVNMQNITDRWTSIIDIVKKPLDRNKLTGEIIKQLFADLVNFDLSAWQKYDYLKNKKIKLIHGQKSISGIACGINDQGHLLLKDKNGNIAAYSSGDTSIQRF